MPSIIVLVLIWFTFLYEINSAFPEQYIPVNSRDSDSAIKIHKRSAGNNKQLTYYHPFIRHEDLSDEMRSLLMEVLKRRRKRQVLKPMNNINSELASMVLSSDKQTREVQQNYSDYRSKVKKELIEIYKNGISITEPSPIDISRMVPLVTKPVHFWIEQHKLIEDMVNNETSPKGKKAISDNSLHSAIVQNNSNAANNIINKVNPIDKKAAMIEPGTSVPLNISKDVKDNEILKNKKEITIHNRNMPLRPRPLVLAHVIPLVTKPSRYWIDEMKDRKAHNISEKGKKEIMATPQPLVTQPIIPENVTNHQASMQYSVDQKAINQNNAISVNMSSGASNTKLNQDQNTSNIDEMNRKEVSVRSGESTQARPLNISAQVSLLTKTSKFWIDQMNNNNTDDNMVTAPANRTETVSLLTKPSSYWINQVEKHNDTDDDDVKEISFQPVGVTGFRPINISNEVSLLTKPSHYWTDQLKAKQELENENNVTVASSKKEDPSSDTVTQPMSKNTTQDTPLAKQDNGKSNIAHKNKRQISEDELISDESKKAVSNTIDNNRFQRQANNTDEINKKLEDPRFVRFLRSYMTDMSAANAAKRSSAAALEEEPSLIKSLEKYIEYSRNARSQGDVSNKFFVGSSSTASAIDVLDMNNLLVTIGLNLSTLQDLAAETDAEYYTEWGSHELKTSAATESMPSTSLHSVTEAPIIRDSFNGLDENSINRMDIINSINSISGNLTVGGLKRGSPVFQLLNARGVGSTFDINSIKSMSQKDLDTLWESVKEVHINDELPCNNFTQTLEKILEDVAEIKEGKVGRAAEGMPCSFNGSWLSPVAGMRIDLSYNDDKTLNVSLASKTPKTKANTNGLLYTENCTDWVLRARLPLQKASVMQLNAINEKEKRVAVFLGECRTCRERHLVFGQWLVAKQARDCEDIAASHQVFSDVWKQESLHTLRKGRLEMLKLTTVQSASTTATTAPSSAAPSAPPAQ